jgi:Ni/Co efflux regulator RcnB
VPPRPTGKGELTYGEGVNNPYLKGRREKAPWRIKKELSSEERRRKYEARSYRCKLLDLPRRFMATQ